MSTMTAPPEGRESSELPASSRSVYIRDDLYERALAHANAEARRRGVRRLGVGVVIDEALACFFSADDSNSVATTVASPNGH